MDPRVLVLGGAGYIGSHMLKHLCSKGYQPTIFDNLSTGHREITSGKDFVEGDIRSADDLSRAFSSRNIDVVMHFAGSCYVGESVADPAKYYSNNVLGTMRVLDAMRQYGVSRLVYSSSCTTYGVPVANPISERHSQIPVSPYGMSKLIAERMSQDYGLAYGINTISLRYFNAAGCDPEGDLRERHDPETHLIPLVLQEALRIRRGGDPTQTSLEIFGDTYSTPDGTCVRDYVHVTDLCEAHLLAMERLLNGSVRGFEAYNLGSETGFSVRQIIDVCRRVTGMPIEYTISGPRAGDPAALVADASKAKRHLQWTPRYTAIEQIVSTAWNSMCLERIDHRS